MLPFNPLSHYLLLALASALPAHAAPASYHAASRPLHRLVPRDGGSETILRVVVPIVLVVAVAALCLIVRFRHPLGNALRHFFNNRVHTPARPRPPSGPRELTAAEMTGTAPVPASTANPSARPSRPRRNRRTPSQISTRSLPAYMKEPGELELVIIQGSTDLEDAPATAVIMPSLPERDSDSTSSVHHDREMSNGSYVHVEAQREAHASTPLLSEHHDDAHDEHEHPRPHTQPNDISTNDDGNAGPRATAGSATEDDALLDGVSPVDGLQSATQPDPRGAAPAYFEVVEGDAGGLSRIDTRDTLPIAPSQTRSSEDHPAGSVAAHDHDGPDSPTSNRRRSVFRGIMHAFSPRANAPPTPSIPEDSASGSGSGSAGPTRQSARFSMHRAQTPSSADGTHNRHSSRFSIRPTNTHRASQSLGSASAFSRTTSRISTSGTPGSAAAQPLTSPSVLSVNSISAPLTHTAIRTDFVYPRSGPTPEQLKLISSVEAVNKFGVPYGPDALAYHASTSFVNLHGPPPEFEERPRASVESRTSLDAVPSRPSIDGLPVPSSPVPGPSGSASHLRTRSALSQAHSAESSSSLPEAPAIASSSGAQPDDPHALATNEPSGEVSVVDEDGLGELGVWHSREGTDATVSRASTRASTVTARPSTHDAEPLPSRASTITVRGSERPPLSVSTFAEPSSPVSTTSNTAPSPTTPKHVPAPILVPSQAIPSAPTSSSAAARRSPSPSPLLAKRPNVGVSAAPTAFKMPAQAGGVRPASRASSVTSVATFATAETSFTETGGDATETEGEDEMVSAPGTPQAF